jgi:hypothetical protein
MFSFVILIIIEIILFSFSFIFSAPINKYEKTSKIFRGSIIGAEKIKLKLNKIISIIIKITKLNIILLTINILEEIGELKIPSNVPDSFSLTNSLAIIKRRVKKMIIQISITNIAMGILLLLVKIVIAEENIKIEIILNNIIEIKSFI